MDTVAPRTALLASGRNPATGETIQIQAKRVVKFRMAKAAKDSILSAK
jgi:DNA-binding protein HU-beta